ncbi:MAG: type I pullulanase [Lachnospiraceae bacterium]|nr:type I pullulanase [Lachnospiraceae bacterium]
MTPYEYKRIYESEAFKKESIEAGESWGALYQKDKTVFKVWAPFAESVSVCLYRTGTDGEAGAEGISRTAMEKTDTHSFSCTVPGDLDGIYYTYEVEREGTKTECTDPYARACGANGLRSMVVNLADTNPAGFAEDEKWSQKKSNTVIYELHVKDFSWQEESGIREEYRGRFMAFTQKGTSYLGHPTGIDYLKEMGITHVHLLPIFDYASVDETGSGEAFNWGYDPENYNVPEGSYATNPYDGHVRIRECKEMIKALHQAGIAVVMDVVYNHTYSSDKAFQVLAPFYYYRQNEDGSLSNGSACGNETASERYMAGSFIRQSVLYWAKEYHIDGFRFDLMGLHDTETMNSIRKMLDTAFPHKKILMYGEPWTAAASPMAEGFYPAVKNNVNMLDNGIAIFNDNTRDAIKGSVFYGEKPGFVNGRKGLEKEVASAALAFCDGGHPFSMQSPAQSINYVSVHDNYTLWDKLVITAGLDDYQKKEERILKENKLAAGIVMMCMGTPLFQAGEEFGRTKYGDENSYKSSPDINCLDWKRSVEFADLTAYYRDLISLRGKIGFFTDKSMDALAHIQIIKAEEDMVNLLIDNASYGRTLWKRIFISFYAGAEAARIELPAGKWQMLADGSSAGLWKKRRLFGKAGKVEKEINTEPVSLCILGSSEQIS